MYTDEPISHAILQCLKERGKTITKSEITHWLRSVGFVGIDSKRWTPAMDVLVAKGIVWNRHNSFELTENGQIAILWNRKIKIKKIIHDIGKHV